MNGVEQIAAERQRQITAEGWTPEHDAQHEEGELAMAATCYATPAPIKAYVSKLIPCSCREASCQHMGGMIEKQRWQDPWPWDLEHDKRKKHDRIRQLVIAGALIAAEIDRLEAIGQSKAKVIA